MANAASTDDESLFLPMALMVVIVGFAIYACCGPAADPKKERPHSFGSSVPLDSNPWSHIACLDANTVHGVTILVTAANAPVLVRSQGNDARRLSTLPTKKSRAWTCLRRLHRVCILGQTVNRSPRACLQR
jgi:hypothetical protein